MELKLYIERALDVVRRKTENIVPFKMCGCDYEKAALERLISTFKKLCDDEVLINDLEKFKEKRNFVAHQAIYLCLDPEGEINVSNRNIIERKLEEIAEEAKRLSEKINEVSLKFMGYYYFGDLPEN